MCTDSSAATRRSYRWCRTLAGRHYENFPVASWLLPRRLRDPIAAIYAFARSADDIADEGRLGKAQRLARLASVEAELLDPPHTESQRSPYQAALSDTIRRYQLPLEPFLLLLSAFRQDLEKTRYANFAELMDYCRRSANPLGRLLLQLTGAASSRNVAHADAICSALQLINFLQDIAPDYANNGRIYLPQEDMRRCGVSEDDIAARRSTTALSRLLHLQLQRATQLLQSASPLPERLPGRFGFELRVLMLAARRVAEKLHKQQDIFCAARLHLGDRIRIMAIAVRPRAWQFDQRA
jgi:squalene synthase HpnC